jgi:hypothetical protein
MITSFELKNRPCCRTFYKIPYFIKNIILLSLMACVMVPTYIFNYRAGELNIKTVYRMIAGLNSDTFEYIQANEGDLMISPSIKSVNAQRVNTLDFYMGCVAVSRPCLLQGMSKTWPAFDKWAYRQSTDKQYYLRDQIGPNTQV